MRILHLRSLVAPTRSFLFAGVLVPACALGALVSVQVGARADDSPARPMVLPTTSVPEVDDLERSLSATLEAAALAEDVPGNLSPSLPDVRLSVSEIYRNGCHVPNEGVEPVVCEYGDEDGDIVAVVLGDSHAGHWLPALEVIADQVGIELIPMTKSGCSVADVAIMSRILEREYTECAEWRERTLDLIAGMHPDIVITSQSSSYTLVDVPEDQWPAAIQAGYAATLSRLADMTDEVIVMADTPYAARDIPNCLWENLRHASVCVRSRVDTFARRLTEVERGAAAQAGVRYVQADDLFCGPTMCPVMVGNILIYRDISHITTVYMAWIAPALGDLLGEPWNAGRSSPAQLG